MNLAPEWVSSLRWGGTFSLEVAVITFLAAGLQRTTRNVLWHRTIWQGAVVGLVLSLLAEVSGLSRVLAGRMMVRKDRTVLAQSGAISESAIGNHAPAVTEDFRNRVADQLAHNQRAPAESGESLAVPGRSAVSGRKGSTHALPPEDPSEEPFLQGKSMPWPELIWIIGIAAILGPMGLARFFFRVTHYYRREAIKEELAGRLGRLGEQVGVRRRVRVYEFEGLKSPIAYGLWRPMIGLPKGFERDYSGAQQEVMLAHELAHHAGHDPAWHALADLMAALLWWHPLAWWARHRLRSVAETAADEASLVVRDGPGVLAECLLRLASRATTSPPAHWLGITGGTFRSELGKRIERLVHLRSNSWAPLDRRWSRTVRLLVPIGLVVTAVAGTAWMNPQNSWKGDSMKTIRENWKRSIATVALFAAFGTGQGDLPRNAHAEGPGKSAPAAPPARPGAAAKPQATAFTLGDGAAEEAISGQVRDARMLIEMGRLPDAERKLQELQKIAPNDPQVAKYLAQISDARAKHVAPSIVEQPEDAKAENANEDSAREEAAQPAPSTIYQMDPALAARYGLLPGGKVLANAAPTATTPIPEEADAAAEQPAPSFRMDPRLMKRYGLMPPNPNGNQNAPSTSTRQGRGKQQLEAKLNQIVLNEILYDNLPLSEVVRDLNDLARKRDPNKLGINFIITSVPEEPQTAAIDPTTGQPLLPTPIDLNNAFIKLHLRDVRLKDVLDAMVRVSDQPIRYTIEDYGVLFSPGSGPGGNFANRFGFRNPETPRLQVRTFRVDTNNFLAGLEGAFGIAPATTVDAAELEELQKRLERAQSDLGAVTSRLDMVSGDEKRNFVRERQNLERQAAQLRKSIDEASKKVPLSRPRQVQQGLRQLLVDLGIDMDVPNKAVFYNDLTGIIMVRATPEDLEIVQAAIETLGGRILGQVMADAEAENREASLMMQRRYGMGSRYGHGLVGETGKNNPSSVGGSVGGSASKPDSEIK